MGDLRPSLRKGGHPVIFAGCILLAILFVVIGGGYLLGHPFGPDHTEELAVPFEKALIRAGAIKKCAYGDSGKGPDNQMPWRDVFFEFPAGRDKAIGLVNKVARDNGYSLTHADKKNRGNLGAVADEFINNWYFDNSRPSVYSDLQVGKINLAFGVNNDGQHLLSSISCNKPQAVSINSGVDTTMITLDIKLPESKH